MSGAVGPLAQDATGESADPSGHYALQTRGGKARRVGRQFVPSGMGACYSRPVLSVFPELMSTVACVMWVVCLGRLGEEGDYSVGGPGRGQRGRDEVRADPVAAVRGELCAGARHGVGGVRRRGWKGDRFSTSVHEEVCTERSLAWCVT